MAFALPVIFNSGTDVLYHLGSLRITVEGVSTGSLFALRMLVLMLASSVLARTTSPEDLTRAAATALAPLRVFGVSATRSASILTHSWMAIPTYWRAARSAIGEKRFRQAGSLRRVVHMLGDMVADLYLNVEPGAAQPLAATGTGPRDRTGIQTIVDSDTS
jgi:energy-coupling factor transporter transmembrane protein EcfT